MSVTSSVPNYKSVNDTANWILPFPSLSLLSRSPVMGWFFLNAQTGEELHLCLAPVTAALEYLQRTRKTYHRVCMSMGRNLFLFYPLSFFIPAVFFRYISSEIIFCPCVACVVQLLLCVNLPPSLVSIQPLNPMSPIHKYWEYTRFR